MIDDPKEVRHLLEALRAYVPFEARLTPAVEQYLRTQSLAVGAVEGRLVRDISSAGDEGGIMCHLDSGEGGEAIAASLTHLLVPASVPAARAVAGYRKRRIKRLKKRT